MAEKDIMEKTLESYEDVFADILNVLIFNGEQRVTPESLKDVGVRSQYKADGKIHEMERDVAKIWEPGNVRFALIGLENQTKSDRMMPLRVIGYDGTAYRAQLLGERKDRYPVITIVLYFGKSHWNQPKNLAGVISIPEGLEKYFNDYRINVFEISWLTDEQVNMFRSDFREVAYYFTQRRKNNFYVPSHRVIKHVNAVLKLLSTFCVDRRFEETIKFQEGSEAKTMSEWFDLVEEKNRAEERLCNLKALIQAGFEFGSKAMVALNVTEEEYAEAVKSLQKTE